MKTALQDVIDRIDGHLAKFEADREDLDAKHEFIANFVGVDEVLLPTHQQLIGAGFTGDAPDGGGWIYMHVERPLTRDSVLGLAQQLDDVANQNRCLFELLDVTLTSGRNEGRIVVLGVCDGEKFQDA